MTPDPVISVFVVGAMKSATTSMCEWLSAQPGLAVSDPKEPAIFVSDRSAQDGLAQVPSYFAHATSGDLLIDGSTDYAKYPQIKGVPTRVLAHNPEARVLYLMRHPLERALSQYRFEWLIGGRREPLDRAIVSNPGLLDYSCYALQLERWLEHVEPARIHLLTSEAFSRDPVGEVGRALAFLGRSSTTGGPVVPENPQTNDSSLLVIRSSRLRRLRGSVLGRAARHLAPEHLVAAYKQGVRQRSEPTIHDDLKAEMTARFDQDLVALSDLTGRPGLTCASWDDVAATWVPTLRTG